MLSYCARKQRILPQHSCIQALDDYFLCTQVPESSGNSKNNADVTSTSNTNSENGEISDQDDQKITLGDALSMTRVSEASPASVEELQNLAGGADIKVLYLILSQHSLNKLFHEASLIQ